MGNIQSSSSLEHQATQLLKGKFKKTRRGSGIHKKNRKKTEHKKLMEQYKQQKKQRAQMFKDFERLINE